MRDPALQEAISQVKARVDIVAVIGRSVHLERAGDRYKALCPFHNDQKTPNFYVSERLCRFKCFACPASGDVIDFIMKTENRDFMDVLRDLAKQTGVTLPTVSPVTLLHGRGGLTLEELASVKKLPLSFLQALGCRNTRRNSVTAVLIPYPDTSSNIAGIRYRHSMKEEPRFSWRKGDHAMPYGLPRLARAKRAGYMVWGEGESDCWTAWLNDLPFLGLPGKSTFRPAWAAYTTEVTNYLWVEPDADDLMVKMAHAIPGLMVIQAPTGAKDISEAHIQGQDVKALLEELRSSARPAADILREQQDGHLRDLRALAISVLASDDPIQDVEAAIIASRYGGDISPVVTCYLSATSRLLAMRPGTMPVHTILLAPASTGKSYVIRTAFDLMPPETYHTIDAGSPSTLIYDESDLQHKTVIYSEADSLPAGEDSPAASAIRNLLQDHHLHYDVTVRDPETGEFTVKHIDKPGPSVLMTTSTRRLGDQLMSRLYSVEIPDDQAQIQAALRGQADLEVYGGQEPSAALLAYQAYLQALAPWKVVVPFARALADEIGKSPAAPRLLRDYARLLSLIKSVTVLRHQHRQRDRDQRLIAALQDYATVYELVKDVYAGSVSGGASAKIRAVVKAVDDLRNEGKDRVTATMVANYCGINKMAASRRIGDAERGGWLVNTEERKNVKNMKNLDVGEPLPREDGLPAPAALCYAGGRSAPDNGGNNAACNSVTPDTEVDLHTADAAHSGSGDAQSKHSNGASTEDPVMSVPVEPVESVTPLHNNGSGGVGTNGSIDPGWVEAPPNEPASAGLHRRLGGKDYVWIGLPMEEDDYDDDDVPF
jgi:hypothetical protein